TSCTRRNRRCPRTRYGRLRRPATPPERRPRGPRRRALRRRSADCCSCRSFHTSLRPKPFATRLRASGGALTAPYRRANGALTAPRGGQVSRGLRVVARQEPTADVQPAVEGAAR